MIRQRASAPGTKERRSRQQQQQNILPQYQQYQQQQQQQPVSSQPQDSALSWEQRDEEVATWSITTNNSGDDLVDEELGGEPDLPIPQTVVPASLPSTSSVSHPAVTTTPPPPAIPTQPSFYRTLYFQIPDSKYREHHHQQQQQQQQQRIHHHRKVRLALPSSSPSSPPSNSKTNKYRFLYFFSSPHMFARALGWYSVVAMLFLIFVGLLIDLQPLYIRGVLPRSTLQNARAMRKFKVLIPSGSSAARLEPAKHAYQAALAYLVTACACWIYGYHWIERAWARIRRRHYKDIPDHYYPDDIHNHNNHHHHHSKDGNIMTRVVSTCSPYCSRISSKSRRFCQSICRGSNAGTRHSNQTPPWQGRCLVFILWWQRLFGALGEVLLMAIRRMSASMRYSSTKRARTRRSAATSNNSSSSLTIPSGNAATTTATANTTATQRKRRKNTAAVTNRNESQSPPHTGASETTATTSSGKHKHG